MLASSSSCCSEAAPAVISERAVVGLFAEGKRTEALSTSPRGGRRAEAADLSPPTRKASVSKAKNETAVKHSAAQRAPEERLKGSRISERR